jgi:protein involved in ribonucleotide reduction
MRRQNRFYRHISDCLFLFVLLSFPTFAATVTVTNTSDSDPGSLRQAIADAAPSDTIKFSVAGTITLTSGQLAIHKNLMIQGPGESVLSISGHRASRVFLINVGVTVTLAEMSIRDGFISDVESGAGISNAGTLIINHSTIRNNTAGEGEGVGIGAGGIYNTGTLTLVNSDVSGNTSYVYTYGIGGGIYSDQYACPCSVINSTVSSSAGNGIDFMNSYHPLTVKNVTVTGNTGYGFFSPYVLLANTIVAGNSGGDIHATIGQLIEDARHNLIGDQASSGGITNGVNGNIVGFSPLLGPLQNNGRPSMTHPLLAGSPAINAGDNTLGIGPTDQRGASFVRISGGNVDIGAFEFSGAEASISGQVTIPGGGGLRNAIVFLSDATGVRRTTLTGSLGYYTFENVTRGPTYTMSVQSRRYRFSANQVQTNEALVIDFEAIE